MERGEKDGSSGLGLYIVRTMTRAMGGSVEAESVLGEGTVFILTFKAVNQNGPFLIKEESE